jgi:hypothetical protein
MIGTPTIASSADCEAPVTRTGGARRWGKSFETLVRWLARGVAGLRDVAPYAAIEIILPGGSLIALILWLYRRR